MPYVNPCVHAQQVRQYVARHLNEKISSARIAQALGLNASYLNTCFRNQTGESVTAYIHRCKIERACRLLRETDRSLAEICAMLGYFDQSHFSRMFRRITGTTPGRYRFG